MVSNIITITDTLLIIEPSHLDKLWSFKKRLELPFSHIKGATLDSGILDERKGIKALGLGMPGKWAGTFVKQGQQTFYNIQRPEEAVVIQLVDEDYDRLVLGTKEPRQLVDKINNLLEERRIL